MNTLTLIRGLPGSGKSTQAIKLCAATKASWYEADMFFQYEDDYIFDPKLLKEAHNWCRAMTRADLARGMDVVVSNTFSTDWEIDLYLTVVQELNAALDVTITVKIIELLDQFESEHDVPEHTIRNMAARWVHLDAPRFKKIQHVFLGNATP